MPHVPAPPGKGKKGKGKKGPGKKGPPGPPKGKPPNVTVTEGPQPTNHWDVLNKWRAKHGFTGRGGRPRNLPPFKLPPAPPTSCHVVKAYKVVKWPKTATWTGSNALATKKGGRLMTKKEWVAWRKTADTFKSYWEVRRFLQKMAQTKIPKAVFKPMALSIVVLWTYVQAV